MNELYKLPNEWEVKNLGQLAKATYGYTEKASFEEIGPKFLRITDIQEDGVNWDSVPFCKINDSDLKKYKLSSGDIVFARTGATTGKSYLVNNPPESVFASYLIKVHINCDGLSPEYLFQFFQTNIYWDSINSGISGSAQGGFNATKLSSLEIPLPPLSEQQRIVSKLDLLFQKIDKSIELHQKNMDEANAFMGSVLNEVFEELEVKKNISLKEITTKIGSGATPSGGEKSYKTEGISLIRSMNVHDNGFRFRNLAFIDEVQGKKLNNVTVEVNDVLLNITGASVARCCIVDESILPARVNQHVSIIRLKNEMYPKFLHYYLTSPTIKSDLLFSSSGGATREAITKSMIESFIVPVPPLPIQQKVVDYFDSVSEKMEKVKSIQKEKMESLKALKASILDKAFRGEL